jgi:hypothetical protein
MDAYYFGAQLRDSIFFEFQISEQDLTIRTTPYCWLQKIEYPRLFQILKHHQQRQQRRTRPVGHEWRVEPHHLY